MEELILKHLVDEGLSQADIGQRLGKSQTSIRYWLSKFGLKTKRSDNSLCYCCGMCGETRKQMFALRHGKYCHTICKVCDNRRAVDRARVNKVKAVAYKGGCCTVCGYNRNIAVLSFHHVDSKRKDPNFDKMKFWGFDRIKKELDKCILVCRNCHAEIHHPI